MNLTEFSELNISFYEILNHTFKVVEMGVPVQSHTGSNYIYYTYVCLQYWGFA